mmetsp:Transcript_8246/g.19121  ORF Transcript_8246/g.19121 Transcript_8246/m.19121 type:complete len:104 (+) Transcript_8246:150-461(+)
MADGPGDGVPTNGADGGNVNAGNVALLSDPVDVIIDKLLRYEKKQNTRTQADKMEERDGTERGSSWVKANGGRERSSLGILSFLQDDPVWSRGRSEGGRFFGI